MSDYIIRATAGNAQIRAFVATTKEMVEAAREAHNTSPVITAGLGRLLTAGSIMGAMLKGDKDILTLQIKGDGPVKGLIVTADSKGNVKGYAKEPQVMLPANAIGKLDVAGAVGKGFLYVSKDLGLKEPYVGQTALQTGEIAEDLTYYFVTSEQTPSSVGLGVLMNHNNTVRQAGGFVIQLMPFAEEEVIEQLEQNLSEITSVTALFEEGNSPEDILNIIMKGLQPEIMEKIPIRFHCNCDKRRVEQALISIGKKELAEILEEGKDIELNCHFCNTNYTFTIAELQKIM